MCDRNPEITKAWLQIFPPEVEIYTGDFQNLPKNMPGKTFVLSTAGNSYGVMDGGLDREVAQYFPGIEEAIRTEIRTIYFGELPVGSCINVPVPPDRHPFISVFYTPTMQVPMRLKSAANVYHATKAAMRMFKTIVLYYPQFEQLVNGYLVLPGFGGKCGGVEPKRIAHAMKLAYKRHTSKEIFMPHNNQLMQAYSVENV